MLSKRFVAVNRTSVDVNVMGFGSRAIQKKKEECNTNAISTGANCF